MLGAVSKLFKMLRIGLTGGIGSGKTTVAKIFEVLGVPVYYADIAAKEIMLQLEVKEKIISTFGKESYNEEGLNRQHISSIVFSDNEKLEQLNAIVHPATIADAENWMKQQTTPYAIKEAALIFETRASFGLDYVIGVFAPEPLRLHRIMRREKVSREEVQKRMDSQIEDAIKMRLCDFVITNDEKTAVIPQVMAIHDKLKKITT